MHNLKIALHIFRVLPQSLYLSDDDLLGTFHIVHSIVMVTRIDDVPVPHALPSTGRTANRMFHDLIGIVGTRRIQYQLHIPNIILPYHNLEVIVLQVLIRSLRGLVPELPFASPA